MWKLQCDLTPIVCTAIDKSAQGLPSVSMHGLNYGYLEQACPVLFATNNDRPISNKLQNLQKSHMIELSVTVPQDLVAGNHGIWLILTKLPPGTCYDPKKSPEHYFELFFNFKYDFLIIIGTVAFLEGENGKMTGLTFLALVASNFNQYCCDAHRQKARTHTFPTVQSMSRSESRFGGGNVAKSEKECFCGAEN